VALDQADMNCRLITGHGLVKIADYTEHKGPGDPSASTVIREVGGGCWVSALSEAGIGGDRYMEPVILRGGRMSSKDGAPVCRDHLAESITLKRGLTGAKPQRFNRWVLDMLGFIDGEDTIDDLYPGTAGMADTLNSPPIAYEVTA